jgi:hypothetical protein
MILLHLAFCTGLVEGQTGSGTGGSGGGTGSGSGSGGTGSGGPPATPPTLHIGLSGNIITVSWANVSHWYLEQNTDLANSTNWVSSNWSTYNGFNYLSLTNPPGTMFFRLHKQ